MGQLMPLLVVLVLTPDMWMVLASLMDTQDSTSGHLLQLKMKLVPSLPPTIPALIQTRQPRPHLLLGNDYFCDTGSEKSRRSSYFTVTILCGMGLGVGL